MIKRGNHLGKQINEGEKYEYTGKTGKHEGKQVTMGTICNWGKQWKTGNCSNTWHRGKRLNCG